RRPGPTTASAASAGRHSCHSRHTARVRCRLRARSASRRGFLSAARRAREARAAAEARAWVGAMRYSRALRRRFPPRLRRWRARRAGEAEDITLFTGTGVHQPMGRDDLVRKLGQEQVDRYTGIAHDAFDEPNLTYVGLSPRGTPLWINKRV